MPRGFDNADVYRDLLFFLPMREGSGNPHDWAKPHHPVTATGAPSWIQTGPSGKLNVLDFNSAHPDFLESPAADTADLNFTTGAFSGCVWVNLNSVNDYIVMMRGLLMTDGWMFGIGNIGNLFFSTEQAATDQVTSSDSGIINASMWIMIGFARDGSSARLYLNGVDVTFTPDSHTNPTTANRKFLIGVFVDEATFPFDGKMWFPRIWGRALDKDEIKYLYETERGLLGV